MYVLPLFIQLNNEEKCLHLGIIKKFLKEKSNGIFPQFSQSLSFSFHVCKIELFEQFSLVMA
jgi:hypothetical protein